MGAPPSTTVLFLSMRSAYRANAGSMCARPRTTTCNAEAQANGLQNDMVGSHARSSNRGRGHGNKETLQAAKKCKK